MSSYALLLIDAAALGLTVAAAVRRHRMAATMVPVASALSDRALPAVAALFIDCDDCLYQNNWATAKKITNSIAAYTAKIGVSKDEAYALYKKHGTCLKGLLVEGRIDRGGTEEFLREVHDISYEDISPDPPLRAELANLTSPAWVFTASTSEHANRCLDRLGLAGLPWRGVIDTRSCELETKHSTHSFLRAMEYVGLLSLPPAGESDGNGNGSTRLSDDEAIAAASVHAGRCLLIDDSVKNIVTAKKMGWCTVLIGKVERDTGNAMPTPAEADHHVSTIHEIVDVLPALFEANEPMAAAAAV